MEVEIVGFTNGSRGEALPSLKEFSTLSLGSEALAAASSARGESLVLQLCKLWGGGCAEDQGREHARLVTSVPCK